MNSETLLTLWLIVVMVCAAVISYTTGPIYY